MRNNNNTVARHTSYTLAAFIAALAVLTACAITEGEVPYTPPRPDKNPPNSLFDVRVALYIDIAQPAAARTALETLGGYSIMAADGTRAPYFDYVVISGGVIKQGRYTPVLEVSNEFVEMVRQQRSQIRRLQGMGIQMLLGITGGHDGVSFGNIPELSQQLFAQQCDDACSLYGFEGVEFWDEGGESADPAVPSPYPEYGGTYNYGIRRKGFNGIVEIPAWLPKWNNPDNLTEEEIAEKQLAEEAYFTAWKEGGKNMSNVMSYLMGYFGSSTSFQGDSSYTWKLIRPIFVRETGYGQVLPGCPERFDFDNTLTCMNYGVNNEKNVQGQSSFGAFIDGEETGRSRMSGENRPWWMEARDAFMSTRDYSPVQIDLSAINDNAAKDRLRLISERLGRSDYGADDEEIGNSDYGLVYYTNLGPYSAGQLANLSVTSLEVFGKPVEYQE